MGFISFIILGLIAGAIAKAIMPGKNGGGWFATMLLGVIGAVVGGWLGSIIFNASLENFWSLQTWALAVGGSIVVLFVWGMITGRKSKN